MKCSPWPAPKKPKALRDSRPGPKLVPRRPQDGAKRPSSPPKVPPRRPNMTPRRPELASRRHWIAPMPLKKPPMQPKRVQRGPSGGTDTKTTLAIPRWLLNDFHVFAFSCLRWPKATFEASNMAQYDPKRVPRRAARAPKRPRCGSEGAKDGPTNLHYGLKTPQEGPRTAQRVPR